MPTSAQRSDPLHQQLLDPALLDSAERTTAESRRDPSRRRLLAAAVVEKLLAGVAGELPDHPGQNPGPVRSLVQAEP